MKNVHRLIHRAFADAVAWDYLTERGTSLRDAIERLGADADRLRRLAADSDVA